MKLGAHLPLRTSDLGPQLPASLGLGHAPAIAELIALRDLEVVDLAPLGGVETAPAARPHAELLRLPPPPRRAATGLALFTELGRAVERFDATVDRPIRAPREAVEAEGRMIALLRGIHGLESQIRSEVARRARA